MLGIISDIHGNFPALKAVLDELDRLQVSDVVSLGDIAGYYSDVNQCCEALRERNIDSVMGNHDWYLVSGNPCPRSDSANKCLEYQRSILSTENLAWLSSFPTERVVAGVRLVHGGWSDPLDEYLVPSERYFLALEGNAFSSGHTHVPGTWRWGEKQYCNPGSVGQPRDGNPKAGFALWDGSSFEIHRVSYDIAETQQRMAKAGFEGYFYQNLSLGLRIGQDP